MKEWYLLAPPEDQRSGAEDEDLQELLDSDIAYDAKLFTADLVSGKTIRAVIQSNLADSKAKSTERMMLCPIGTCAGMAYVKYKDKYWLITNLVDNNKVYEKALIVLCNYKLAWMTDGGNPVERWANVTDSTATDGEDDGKYYILRSDRLIIKLPDDEESLKLETGRRFIIDKRCEIYEKEMNDLSPARTDFAVNVFRMTRADNVVYDYRERGMQQIIAIQDEQHGGDGYYRLGTKGYWLCPNDIKPEEKKTSVCRICGDTREIYPKIDPVTFTAKFYGADGKETQATPVWDVVCDFASSLDISYAGNGIIIGTNDERLVGRRFELKLNATGFAQDSIIVPVRNFL